MSAVASVAFAFDGRQEVFKRLCDAMEGIDLDIAAFSKGRTGVIEFMIGDFGTTPIGALCGLLAGILCGAFMAYVGGIGFLMTLRWSQCR
jgi:hypothetical protein